MKGSHLSAGESGGVGAVAVDEDSWKSMSVADPGSNGLDGWHWLESSRLSKLHLC